jgi:hypothetical protein
MTTFSREYIEQVKQTLDIFPHEQFEALVNVLVTALRNKRNIFVMGQRRQWRNGFTLGV